MNSKQKKPSATYSAKSLLRRVLPLRSSVFANYRNETNRRFRDIEGSIFEYQDRVREYQDGVSRCFTQIEKEIEDSRNLAMIVVEQHEAHRKSLGLLNYQVNQIESHIEQLSEEVQNAQSAIAQLHESLSSDILYEPNWEKGAIEPFRDVIFGNNFKEIFFRFADGFDRQSIGTLATVIARQRLVLENDGCIDLYSPEEKEQLRALRWRLAHGVTQIDEGVFCFEGYLLPINQFEPCVFVYRQGIGELSNIESIAKKDIIDVGAFVGDSALILSPLTSGNVISFEPTKENYLLLEKTIELNHLTNVIPEKLALGGADGMAQIAYSGSTSKTLSGETSYTEKVESIRMTTLDDYCRINNLEIGLIKVDIEGYEQEFLKGAQSTIKSQRPTLLISIYHNPDDFYNIKPLIDSWDLGYKFRIHKPLDSTISREVMLICEQG